MTNMLWMYLQVLDKNPCNHKKYMALLFYWFSYSKKVAKCHYFIVEKISCYVEKVAFSGILLRWYE